MSERVKTCPMCMGLFTGLVCNQCGSSIDGDEPDDSFRPLIEDPDDNFAEE